MNTKNNPFMDEETQSLSDLLPAKTAQDMISSMLQEAGVTVVDGRRGRVLTTTQPVTNSLKVAEFFGKSHKNVLRAIGNIMDEANRDLAISRLTFEPRDSNGLKIQPVKQIDPDAKTLAGFCSTHFKVSAYTDSRGKTQPAFIMSRKGFEFLTLGFTGRKAMMFRMAYIERFHEMEAQIKQSAREAADTAYRHPQFKKVTHDYGKGAVVVLKEFNPDHKPLPSSVRAVYDEDSEIFETKFIDPLRVSTH